MCAWTAAVGRNWRGYQQGSSIVRLEPLGLVERLTQHGVPFAEVSSHRATLEQAYLEITRDAVEFRAEATAEVAQ